MSNFTINIEFLAGTEFSGAVEEAKMLARRMDAAYVCFNFNNTKCSIGQNCDVRLACKDYADNKKHICHS